MSSGARTTNLLVAGVALMVVAGMGPWMILLLLGQPNLASAAILPGIALTIACVTGSGWRIGLMIVGPFAALCALASWASPSPWWSAVVLAAAASLRGYAAREGLHDALSLTVITLGFLVATPSDFGSPVPAPVLVGAVSLGAGLWATLVIFALRSRIPRVTPVHLNPIRVLGYSLTLAVLIGVATFFVVSYNLGQTGGWIILTILVVFQPYFGAGLKKAGSRALGTIAGLCITIAIGAAFPTGPILYAFGSVFVIVMFLFLIQNRPYWLYAMVLTPTVVLMDSADSTVTVVALERLKGTLIGIAFTLLVMLALWPLVQHLETRPTAPSP